MKHTLSSKGLSWTNMQSPEPNELAAFIRESGLETSDAEFVAQKYHRSSITFRHDYILLLIHIPIFDRKLRLTKGAALFFIITPKKLFSLHYEPIVSLDKIRRNFELSPDKLEEFLNDNIMSFCLDVLVFLYDGAFKKLEKLTKHIDIAEDAVFQGNERKMVEEISLLTRDVMDFRKVIRPQKTLFAAPPEYDFASDDVITKWNRIHGQLLKMWEVLESMFESVRELSSTNFTLIQHKENELLRILTVYSIIVIPMLILVDPIFTPGAPNANFTDIAMFWVVLGLLITTLLIILLHFRNKRLL